MKAIRAMTFEAQELRRDYVRGSLDDGLALPDPFAQFQLWLDAAIEERLIEANAMIVATVNPDGAPNLRTVLMKEFSEHGLVFGSNFSSQKGSEITGNPNVSALFYWAALERQVRISGTCARTTDEESDLLYSRRPVDARISAAASPQSQVIPDRMWIERKTADLRDTLGEGEAPPRPDFWGGFRITPALFEFWQGRPNRTHDRIQYRNVEGVWLIERLAP